MGDSIERVIGYQRYKSQLWCKAGNKQSEEKLNKERRSRISNKFTENKMAYGVQGC